MRSPHLDAVAQLGDFFDLTAPAPEGAVTLRAFSADPTAIAAEVEHTIDLLRARSGAAEVESRAAASLVHLGLVARIVAPVVGAEALFGEGVDVSGSVVHRVEGRRLVLSATDAGPAAADPAHLGAGERLLGVLRALGDGFGQAASLSPVVMWGNAGSAIVSAAAMVSRMRPDRAGGARSAAARLLATGELAGTGAFVDGAWRRASCCLYYRLPGGGLCGDCVLVAAPTSQR